VLPRTRIKRFAGAAIIVFPILAAIVGIAADAGGALNTLNQFKDRLFAGGKEVGSKDEVEQVDQKQKTLEMERLTGATGQRGNSQFLETDSKTKFLPKGTLAANVRQATKPYLIDDKKCQQFFNSQFRGKFLPDGGWIGEVNQPAAQTANGQWWISMSEEKTQTDVIAVTDRNLRSYAVGDKVKLHGTIQTGCTKWIVLTNAVVSIQD